MSKSKKKPGRKKKLSDRHKKFIDLFIETGNATQSYIDAKYSETGAGQAARNLLNKTYIVEYLNKRRAEIAKKADITADDVIKELAKIAFANSEDFFEWGEQQIELIPDTNVFTRVSRILIKPPDKINRDKKAAISGIKETAKGGLEFKFHDKIKALENLSKYFGTSTDAEVDKAKKIKETEKQPAVDPTAGMTRDEVQAEIKKLRNE